MWPDPNDPNSLFDPNNPFTPPDVPEVQDTSCGLGGGLVCWSSDALIENCVISQNTADGSGGGVYFGGDPYTPLLKNSLIKDNTATIDGGGIASHWFAAPTIANCTIVGNQAVDFNVDNRGKGGGLVCSHSSNTTLINSILWNNAAQQGSQISIGSDSDPVYIQRPATLTVSYSDIQGGRLGLHIEAGRTLNWLDGNIQADPLFVESYFLSQIAAGQSQDSPAVDAGSATAAQIGLADATTRTDAVPDGGTVDMGFHYSGQGRYYLQVEVIGGHGTVTPTSGYYHEFEQVTLTAHPQDGYRVRQWTGADRYPAWNQNTNVVTMSTDNQYVVVEFEKDVTRNIIVPDEYSTIEAAITAASPGDTNIIVKEGVHYVSTAAGIDLQSKAVRIMSTDPNDPNVVATTVIDCGGSQYIRKRAFHFYRGEGPDTLIAGITIRNGYWAGAIGGVEPNSGGEVNPGATDTPIQADSGQDVSGTGYGGAILCENGSSPTFRNVVIENCVVVAAQGGDGVSGQSIPANADTDGVWGGNGGSGTGYGYGGAVACLNNSRPTFINCTFSNCAARGGMGGSGGSGSLNQGSGNASYGGDSGAAFGDGHGGAVYCGDGCDAVFERCIFVGNEASSGLSGTPGAAGEGSDLPDDYGVAGPGTPGAILSYGTIAGGAVYQGYANPEFTDCEFTQNIAYESYVYYSLITRTAIRQEEIRISMPGGGLFAEADSTVSLERCEFSENTSNAVYVDWFSTVDINDCVFSKNSATGSDVMYSSTYVDYSGGALTSHRIA